MEEVRERFLLTATHFLTIAQVIHFCCSRLIDLSREGIVNSVDELLKKGVQRFWDIEYISGYISGIEVTLPRRPARKPLRDGEKVTRDPDVVEKLLQGLKAICKFVVNETRRET